LSLLGIHHITALASDPQLNVDFYTDVLGLRLVKKTVNFDSPDVYHLYYGDEIGTPGTLLTFFPFPNAARGKRGSGEISAIAYTVGRSSLDYWMTRLSSKGISFDGPTDRYGDPVIAFLDPDGMKLELVVSDARQAAKAWSKGPVSGEHSLARFHGVTIQQHNAMNTIAFMEGLGFRKEDSNGNRRRFLVGAADAAATVDVIADPSLPPARQSAGSVHHIAWRVPDDGTQAAWRERILGTKSYVTEIVDRCYFRSIYFREPGGVLYEIATNGPGMLIDENIESLGTALKLPPWMESQRAGIEKNLIPLKYANVRSVV